MKLRPVLSPSFPVIISRFGILLALVFCIPLSVHAEPTRDPQGIGIEEHLGESIPIDIPFVNEKDESVTLRNYLKNGKPIVIAPAYYECPRLCTYVYNGLRDTIRDTMGSLQPGKDYLIVSISFNPKDNPALASFKGDNYRSSIKTGKVTADGWQFLTGTQENIAKIMGAIGYNYRPDGEMDFSHPAAIVVISPEGIISRYFYGIQFPSRDYKFSLIEASKGRIGSTTDLIIMSCFRYDEQDKKYSPYAWGFMRIGSVLLLIGLGAFFLFLRRKERSS